MIKEDPIHTMFDAMLRGEHPGAIEASETRGQAALVTASKTSECHLPRAIRDCKPHLEVAGVKFLGDVPGDDLFQRVQLPPGWEIKRTDHSMWTKLCDDKGRERAAIFYKAVFYDRSAHMNMTRRFRIESYAHADHNIMALSRVMDQDKVLFESERLPLLNDDDKYGAKIPGEPPHVRAPSKRDLAAKQCSEWLAANYPDWGNVSAYWD